MPVSLTLRKNTIKFAACIWSLLICGDPGKSTRPRYGSSLVHSDDSNTLLIALRRCLPSRERLRFMEEGSCMGTASMALTFLVICYGQNARQLGRSASWNLKHNGMLISNMQAFFIHLVSGTSMMDSACELRSVSVYLHLRLFNYRRRRRCPLIWCCHVQL